MRGWNDWGRMGPLGGIALLMLLVLQIRIMILIVTEYPNYFPPNFDAAFLIGRQGYFSGLYATAFFAHIIAGPLSIIFGGLLLWSGYVRRAGRIWHRYLGKLQAAIVLLVVLPSGVVMSTRAYTGVIAGLGFIFLSFATATCLIAAIQHARNGNLGQHRVWALRCYVLLCSPLLMRLMSGAVITLELESVSTYQFCAWASWLVPWAILECLLQYKSGKWPHRHYALPPFDRGV